MGRENYTKKSPRCPRGHVISNSIITCIGKRISPVAAIWRSHVMVKKGLFKATMIEKRSFVEEESSKESKRSRLDVQRYTILLPEAILFLQGHSDVASYYTPPSSSDVSASMILQ
jgi:hypothetical protein